MPDSDLIDAIKDEFGWRHDLEVARFLGLSKDAISLIRGGGALGRAQRAKLYDRLARCQVPELILHTSIEALSSRLPSANATEELASSRAASDSDQVLLEAFKHFAGFATDAELAGYLGIKRNSVSMVRTGRSRLGQVPRLRMLALIEKCAVDEAERAIESSEFLLRLIRSSGLKKDYSTPIPNSAVSTQRQASIN